MIALVYNVSSQKNKYFFWYLKNLLEFYSIRYEQVIILGYFNMETENKVMKDFLLKHTFYNMIKQNTCSKGNGGLCIDLLITNSKLSYLETNSFETALSDHMIYTILKTKIWKVWIKEIDISQFQTIW